MNRLALTVALLAVLLAGCGSSAEDTTTTTAATIRTGPPPTGPCKHLYQPSTQGQALVEINMSQGTTQGLQFTSQLIRIEGSTQIEAGDAQVVGSCIRSLIPQPGKYMVYVRTPDHYSGKENCYWHGGSGRFDFNEQAYVELQAVMNFQCTDT